MRAAALAGVLLPSVARAAEGGMPQLDFASPLTVAQVVWLAIIFLVLYLLLGRWALPRVGEVIAHRAAVIGADLDAARSAKAEADAAQAEQLHATRDAQSSAQAEIAAAVNAAKADAVKDAALAGARLEAQLAAAEMRIEAQRDQAMGALRQVANDTAAAMIERLTGRAPDSGQVDHAVAGALAARPA